MHFIVSAHTGISTGSSKVLSVRAHLVAGAQLNLHCFFFILANLLFEYYHWVSLWYILRILLVAVGVIHTYPQAFNYSKDSGPASTW